MNTRQGSACFRAHERSVPVDQDAIVRVDTCQLAANSPIEDFYSAAKCKFSCFSFMYFFLIVSGFEAFNYVS